jgi:Icc-related predicted phosphoesterase/uncharacterized protein YprB with RNaseH-like and TPR domain
LKRLESVGKPVEKPLDSEALRIVAFSDYRVQDISLLLDFIRALHPRPNLILYAGDDVERFHTQSENLFEHLAATSTHGLCAVLGNDPPEEDEESKNKDVYVIPDTRALRRYIRGAGVYNVHETPLVIGDYAVIGSEGAPIDERLGHMGVVIYSEASIARHLRLAAKRAQGKRLILVSHSPPRGSLDFAIRFGKRPIGSVALRTFLRKRRDVPLVVCGHVHYCGGQSTKLGRSMIVNAASHDDHGAPGKVAVIDIQAGKVSDVQWHELRGELTSIAGIGEPRGIRLKAAGIRNVAQLAGASEECIRKTLKCGAAEAAIFRARASSQLRQEMLVLKRLELWRNRAYVDIETDLNSNFIWLIGLHIEDEAKSYSFFANTPQDEGNILREFLDVLAQSPELTLLAYSNCRAEQRLLAQRLSANGLPTTVAENIADVYSAIHSCVVFPVQDTRLKTIAKCCGFLARHPDMEGFDAAISYGSGRLTKKRKKLLLEYNEDDMLGLKHVFRYIESRTQPAVATRTTSEETLSLF